MEFFNRFNHILIWIVCFNAFIHTTAAMELKSTTATPKISNLPPIQFPTGLTHNTQQPNMYEPPLIFPPGPTRPAAGTALHILLSKEPPEIFPTDASVLELKFDQNNRHVSNIPPLYFPYDTKAFKIVPANNETALKILREHTDYTNRNMTSTSSTEPNQVDMVDPKMDVEQIQRNDGTKQKIELEEQYHKQSGKESNLIGFNDKTIVDHPRISHGHIMAIIAGTMAILCISAYIALILWRHHIKQRYGHRERLVNEEDYCDDRNRTFNI